VLDLVLKGKRLKPSSKSNYSYAFRSLAWVSEDWPESSAVINEWVASLNWLSDSTVRSWFTLVKAGGKYAKKVLNINNPCEDAERPKVSKKRRRYYSVQELVAIVKACKDQYELLLILTLIDSACRIGELVGLRGRDVGDGFIDVEGKTGQRRYRLDGRISEKLKVLAGGQDEAVFKHKDGGFHRSSDSLGHRVRYITARAGLTGIRLGPHTIRHSSASLLATEWKQVLLVKALLQHDDIETSMGYIHDAEELVIKDDRYSPLGILGSRMKEGESQGFLELTEGEVIGSMDIVPAGERGISEAEDAEIISGMFPEVKDGVAVRTVLRDEDLSLIREVFIFYALYHNDGRVGKASALMRRMLRKGGSDFYSKNSQRR